MLCRDGLRGTHLEEAKKLDCREEAKKLSSSLSVQRGIGELQAFVIFHWTRLGGNKQARTSPVDTPPYVYIYIYLCTVFSELIDFSMQNPDIETCDVCWEQKL